MFNHIKEIILEISRTDSGYSFLRYCSFRTISDTKSIIKIFLEEKNQQDRYTDRDIGNLRRMLAVVFAFDSGQ